MEQKNNLLFITLYYKSNMDYSNKPHEIVVDAICTQNDSKSWPKTFQRRLPQIKIKREGEKKETDFSFITWILRCDLR